MYYSILELSLSEYYVSMVHHVTMTHIIFLYFVKLNCTEILAYSSNS